MQGAMEHMDEPIGFLIKKIHHKLAAGRNRDLKYLELTGAQLDILTFLLQQGSSPVCQKDIGDFLEIKHTSTIDVLKKLEEKQLIYRSDSPDKGRRRDVHLTESGRQLADKLAGKRQEVEAILTDGFSAEERTQLWQQLKRIYKNMEKYNL